MTGTSRSGGSRKAGIDHTPEDGGPDRPELPDDIASKWDELIEQLPIHALRKVDVHQLKELARLMAYSDSLHRLVLSDPLDHKTGRMYLGVQDRIHRLSASFGLTPADRKRLSLEPEQEDDPLQQYLRDDV
jgi:hypothetical protein